MEENTLKNNQNNIKQEDKNIKETLYDKIDISLNKIDKFIFCMIILLIFCIIFGMIL